MPVFQGYDTDKANGYHSYDSVYEEYFTAYWPDLLRTTVGAVLELGILRGGALRALRDYFPKAEIVGLDIDSSTMIRHEERITTYCGSAFQKDDLQKVGRLHKYDVIIDDASHVPVHQYQALKYLWPHLRVGGLYFIEDLEMRRNGADVLSMCSRIVRDKADIELHLGPGSVPADDMLILEKR